MRLRQKDPEFNVACVRERERKRKRERERERERDRKNTPKNSSHTSQ
jgi:hypothetical protein